VDKKDVTLNPRSKTFSASTPEEALKLSFSHYLKYGNYWVIMGFYGCQWEVVLHADIPHCKKSAFSGPMRLEAEL